MLVADHFLEELSPESSSLTNTEPAESARQTKLATALDEPSLAGTSSALGAGAVSAEHAAVIAGAIRRLPAGLTVEQVAAVESDLLAKARRMNPHQLRKAARGPSRRSRPTGPGSTPPRTPSCVTKRHAPAPRPG